MMVITKALLEANRICQKLKDATGESFLLITVYGNTKENNTISITSGRNPLSPFPMAKALDVQEIIGGMKTVRTRRDYTALKKSLLSDDTIISITLYTGPCLNPDSHEGMKIERGTMGRVLNPEDCDGLEDIFRKYFEE